MPTAKSVSLSVRVAVPCPVESVIADPASLDSRQPLCQARAPWAGVAGAPGQTYRSATGRPGLTAAQACRPVLGGRFEVPTLWALAVRRVSEAPARCIPRGRLTQLSVTVPAYRVGSRWRVTIVLARPPGRACGRACPRGRSAGRGAAA